MSDSFGYEYYDDDERAEELAELQARIAALSDPSTDPGATEPGRLRGSDGSLPEPET